MRSIIIYGLGIWAAIVSVVNSMRNELSLQKLRNLEEILHEASDHMEREAKDEDSAICVGVTKSGKSTLVNYLIGNPLIGERINQLRPITISKADNSPGPEIGTEILSQTKIPTRWTSSRLFPNMSIWDAPGFDDNRGAVQDITNAFYMNQLLRRVKSLKIILVVDFHSIAYDNIEPFLLSLRSIEGLLGENMRYFFESISVIFSKVPETFNSIQVDIPLITEMLKEKILSDDELSMSQLSRDYVKFLTENKNRIGLFKRAKIGPVTTSDVDVNIVEAINNSQSIKKSDLAELRPSISDSSMVVLYNARDALVSTASFQNLQNTVSYVLDSKVNQIYATQIHTTAKVQLNNIQRDLMKIKELILQAINPALKLREKIDILELIDPSIEKVIKEQKLIEKVNLLGFIDKLMDLRESNVFQVSFNGVLLIASNKVTQYIIVLKLRIGEITQQESLDALQDQRKHYEEEYQKVQEELLKVQEENMEKKNKLYVIIGEIVKAAIQIIPAVIASGK